MIRSMPSYTGGEFVLNIAYLSATLGLDGVF